MRHRRAPRFARKDCSIPPMDAMHLLLSRASNGRLTEPAPDDSALAQCFAAAVRAPDHGLLRPFRFHVIRGDARHALGQLMGAAHKARNPDASADAVEQQSKKALRAPLIIVVSAVVQDHPKVPRIEQVLAAGAAAQNILLALAAQGYAAIWRTGPVAYDQAAKAAFGLRADDALVALLYVGTPQSPPPPLERPVASELVQEWPGHA